MQTNSIQTIPSNQSLGEQNQQGASNSKHHRIKTLFIHTEGEKPTDDAKQQDLPKLEVDIDLVSPENIELINDQEYFRQLSLSFYPKGEEKEVSDAKERLNPTTHIKMNSESSQPQRRQLLKLDINQINQSSLPKKKIQISSLAKTTKSSLLDISHSASVQNSSSIIPPFNKQNSMTKKYNPQQALLKEITTQSPKNFQIRKFQLPNTPKNLEALSTSSQIYQTSFQEASAMSQIIKRSVSPGNENQRAQQKKITLSSHQKLINKHIVPQSQQQFSHTQLTSQTNQQQSSSNSALKYQTTKSAATLNDVKSPKLLQIKRPQAILISQEQDENSKNTTTMKAIQSSKTILEKSNKDNTRISNHPNISHRHIVIDSSSKKAIVNPIIPQTKSSKQLNQNNMEQGTPFLNKFHSAIKIPNRRLEF